MQACESCRSSLQTEFTQSHTPVATLISLLPTTSLQWRRRKSRNNQRYAFVMQDLATQWIQSMQKQKLHKKRRAPKKIQRSYTQTIHWFWATACEAYQWNHCTSTHLIGAEISGIVEGAARRVKKGTYIPFTAIRTWWKGVGRIYGMFLLLMQCPRSSLRFKNSIWTAFLKIQSEIRVSSDNSHMSGKAPSVSRDSTLSHLYGLRSICGEKLEGRSARGRRRWIARERHIRTVFEKNVLKVLVPKGDNFTLLIVSVKLAGQGSSPDHPTEFGKTAKKEKKIAVIFKEKRTNQILHSNNESKMNWKQSMISGAAGTLHSSSSCSRRTKIARATRKARFPIPLKYIDVVRRTSTTLDVLQECQSDDSWIVNGERSREIDKDSSNVQAPEHVARNLVRYVKEISARRKTALGRRRAKAQQSTKAERYLSYRSRRQEMKWNQKNSLKKLEWHMGLCNAV